MIGKKMSKSQRRNLIFWNWNSYKKYNRKRWKRNRLISSQRFKKQNINRWNKSNKDTQMKKSNNKPKSINNLLRAVRKEILVFQVWWASSLVNKSSQNLNPYAMDMNNFVPLQLNQASTVDNALWEQLQRLQQLNKLNGWCFVFE